jgi:outer membrane lipoprotein SlyB
MAHAFHVAMVFAALLGMTACAPTQIEPAHGTTDIASISRGVIVSMRQLQPRAARDDIRGSILAAIGSSADIGPAAEFIVREDNGQTVSVVQTDDANFQPGDHVLLTRGPHTRIARAPGS